VVYFEICNIAQEAAGMLHRQKQQLRQRQQCRLRRGTHILKERLNWSSQKLGMSSRSRTDKQPKPASQAAQVTPGEDRNCLRADFRRFVAGH